MPQVHAPGVEAEVDWGQAEVELAGAPTTVHLFVMRASFSGAAFCQASLVETQQAFLELHVQAFEWFGGVFAEIRFDNLNSAVKKVLKGRRRVESDRFVALRSHYLFALAVHDAGPRGRAREGRRRGRGRPLPPQPPGPGPARSRTSPSSTRCCSPAARPTSAGGSTGAPGRSARRGPRERPLLVALPAEPFDSAEAAAPRVDQKSLVTIRQNRYSVPVALAGPEGQRARRRARDHDQPRRPSGRAPRAAARPASAPARSSITTSSCSRASPAAWSTRVALAQERDRGAWPDCFDELWAALTGRYGRSDAARQMVDVVLLCREHGPDRVALAVRGALTAGAIDGRAVAVLARRAESARPARRRR